MIRASIYGRLGGDPIERSTYNDKPMATASLAVNAARANANEDIVWVSLAAFGKTAEALLRNVKGDLLAAMGTLYRTRFTGRDGGGTRRLGSHRRGHSVGPHRAAWQETQGRSQPCSARRSDPVVT